MKNIAAALVKAQKGFSPALKTSTNPHYRSKYADLSACIEAVIDSLNANGICLLQNCHECEDGVIVETIFMHESGEFISAGKLHVPAGKKDPQGYGSALTYARRYSLMAACGIAPEDDDGNAASKKASSPVKAALDGVQINEEDQQYLRDLAAELVQHVEVENDPRTACDKIDKAMLDSDQKLFLWNVLQPNSKTRTAIKKEQEARKGQS